MEHLKRSKIGRWKGSLIVALGSRTWVTGIKCHLFPNELYLAISMVME